MLQISIFVHSIPIQISYVLPWNLKIQNKLNWAKSKIKIRAQAQRVSAEPREIPKLYIKKKGHVYKRLLRFN